MCTVDPRYIDRSSVIRSSGRAHCKGYYISPANNLLILHLSQSNVGEMQLKQGSNERFLLEYLKHL